MTNAATGGGTPWLVKFQASNEHKEVCAIESLYAKIAQDCDIDMEQTRYFNLDKKLAAFAVKRFDRKDGMRVPMHTLAGALHMDFRVPSVDYTTFLRATKLFTRDQREVLKAFGRCVFNVVFNNRDDHAKNFSFCLDKNRQWRLSPAYDLTFSEGPGGEHQMDVCGEGQAPGKEHLMKLVKQTDIPVASALRIIDNIVDKAVILKVKAEAFNIRGATLKRIVSAVEQNRSRLV